LKDKSLKFPPKPVLTTDNPYARRNRKALESVSGSVVADVGEVLDSAIAVMQEKLAQLRHLKLAHGIPSPRKARAVAPRQRKWDANIDAARERGQAQLVDWVQDGTLLPSQAFATKWGMTPQGLHAACVRCELMAIKVSNRLYYPALLLDLPREFASELCVALAPLPPAKQLIFLLRSHGVLEGKSIPELAGAKQFARALELARSWSSEQQLAVA